MLNKIIEDVLKKVGVHGDIKLTVPPKPEMGDLAFACFDIAKKKGKNSNEIATEIKKKLEIGNWKLEILDKVEVFGPYVNFYLNAGEVAKLIISEVEKKNFGANDLGKGEKMMIEYPSQNTHKEFHIGHLRNVCIGSTLVQLYKKCGFGVVPVNYINDFGSHVVRCLWWILRSKKFRPKADQPRADVKFIKSESRQRWLGEMYAEASGYIKEHEEVKPELDALQKKLETREKEIMKLFKETRKWSLGGFKKIDKELGLKYKELFLESEVKDCGQKVVDELLKKGIAQVGEGGAIITDLSKCGLDIALLRKSTGAGVYMTSDLGLAEKKFKKYKVDESINLTGSEQNFYFQQLFKILELNGFKHKMSHIGYGLVTRPEGKMSSRLGNVILYEDLRDEVYEKVLEETRSRHSDWTKRQIENTAKIIALGAIKFELLKHEAIKNIVFDIKSATSFDGFTGPYVLYVVARINSILRKSKLKTQNSKLVNQLKTSEEKRLVMMLGEYGEVVKKAMENYNPSVIVKYCFDVAQSFNDFYTKHSVLNAENKELVSARVILCGVVRKVLKDALGLLAIETVEEM